VALLLASKDEVASSPANAAAKFEPPFYLNRRYSMPKTPTDIRQFIREMSVANRLWGAPPIHVELLKLGIDIG
jgi:hypothetical protein